MANMNNKDYWEKRSLLRGARAQDTADQAIHRINRAYDQAVSNINDEITKIMQTYGSRYDLSEEEVKRILEAPASEEQLNDLRMAAQSITDPEMRRKAMKHVTGLEEAHAYGARINRFEALKERAYVECKRAGATEINQSTKAYGEAIEDTYYHNVYDFQHQAGMAYNFAGISQQRVQEMLKTNWSGKMFSDRVWDNTDILAKKLQDTMTAGILSGKSVWKLADELKDQSNYGKFAAERLIRTEMAAFTSEADKAAAEERGTKYMIFVATLDMHTSEICQEHDGNRIPVKEVKPGKNAPPLHPNCRSCLIEDLEGYEHRVRWARDPETGKGVKVPAAMTYPEWKEKFVKEHGESRWNELQRESNYSNGSTSNKYIEEQFERYRGVLGELFPYSSPEEFLKMKLDNPDEWKELQKKYRIVNQYQNQTENAMDPKDIYRLHNDAYQTKREKFSSNFKFNGNMGIMDFDGEIYYAHSRANYSEDKAYKNFRGDKDSLIIKPVEKTFQTTEFGRTYTEGNTIPDEELPEAEEILNVLLGENE